MKPARKILGSALLVLHIAKITLLYTKWEQQPKHPMLPPLTYTIFPKPGFYLFLIRITPNNLNYLFVYMVVTVLLWLYLLLSIVGQPILLKVNL